MYQIWKIHVQSQQKHDWGTIGANFPGQCQGAELFDTGYQMAVATTSKLSWKLWDEWRHGYQPGERLTVCMCFLFFCWSPVSRSCGKMYIFIYIYTHNLICHREQSKWSKDLCISAVAVVVSLIISMCFFIFSWSDGLDLEIPPKPIESAQIHWVTKVFDQ